MKVCFFSPAAYSYFISGGLSLAGGAELQQVLIAEQMVKHGIDVSFIVGDFGQPDAEIIDGITLIKSFEPDKGNRKLRFVPDMIKIRRAMQVADADIYNQRSTSFFTGQLLHFARRLGKRFTFSLGIDYNCYPDCSGLLPPIMAPLYRYGINHSDAVIAQTRKQMELLKENFGRDSVLIRNGINIPPAGDIRSLDDPGDEMPEFLWVGSIRRRKRPELFIELARRVKDASFTMVGGKGIDNAFHDEIRGLAGSVPNLTFLGFIPPSEISQYYRRAYALINTSNLEGFPNTYLHSWSYGVPTITMEIDPDSIIEDNRIGYVSGSFEGLVESTIHLCGAPDERAGMSGRARRYVVENHDIADRGSEYIDLFRKIHSREESITSSRSG